MDDSTWMKLGRFVVLAFVACCLPTAYATGTIDIIAITGQTAPDETGEDDGAFATFLAPVLNNNGQVAFRALDMTGTSAGFANDVGIFRSSNTPGSLIQIMREGMAAPRSGFGGSGTSNGIFSSSLTDPVINIHGVVAFRDSSIDASSSPTSTTGVFTSDGVDIDAGLRTGDSISARTVNSISGVAINATGRLGFTVNQDGDFATDTFVGARAGSTLFTLAREGSATGSGGNFGNFSTPTLAPAMNQSGQIAVGNTPSGTSNSPAIFRLNTSSAGGDVTIAHANSSVPGGNGNFSFFSTPLINDSGAVAFEAFLSGTSGGTSDDDGIYRGTGSFLSQIARSGQNAPGGDGRFSSISDPDSFNNNNQVAFQAFLTSTTLGSLNDSGIYRGSGGTPTEIVREGDAAPDGNGEFSNLSTSTQIRMNEGGQVVFRATLRDTIGGSTDNQGIFLGDGQEIITVARYGDVVAGKTITGFLVRSGQDTGGTSNLNDHGQVAYRATFSDGDSAILLFTPELHYRRAFSSSWDSSGSWTIGLTPTDVHDVLIDPAASVTVNGPSGDTTVKSLQIGGDIGIATLALQAGAAVTPMSGVVEIESTGVLTGDGAINGDVSNNGTVSGNNVTILGTLTNQSLINTALDGGRISATSLDNNAAGTIAVENEGLLIIDAPTTNHGTIETIGTFGLSTVRFDQAVTNAAGGQIRARDATVYRFNNGLMNEGSLGLAFANTTVFGDVTNNGVVAVTGNSNALFNDDIINNGELRVTSGSQSVFFGNYSGVGAITGGGTTFFEGGFSPGASPFLATAATDVSFGFSNTTLIELAGSIRGTGAASEYDGLDVLGGKTLMLNGVLDVVFIDDLTTDYTADLGDVFTIFTAAEILGDFREVRLPELAEGLRWLVNNDGTAYSLAVAAVPVPPALVLLISALGLLLKARKRPVI